MPKNMRQAVGIIFDLFLAVLLRNLIEALALGLSVKDKPRRSILQAHLSSGVHCALYESHILTT